MLSVVLAIVVAAYFIFMLIALSYAFDLAEKLERVEAELEECRRPKRTEPRRAGRGHLVGVEGDER